MAHSYTLLDLPDLVLHKICMYIPDPFDLVYFGNTCTRIRRISSSPSLWWPIAFRWCDGLWIYIDSNPDEDHPRDWLLQVLRSFMIKRFGTEMKCEFSGREEWKRVDSYKFRCLVGMVRLAYEKHKDNHPAILYEQWLYDIGLYRRVNVCNNFASQNFEFNRDVIEQLTKLGQAEERDLRRRKQPNKDLRYYIKRVNTAGKEWMSELFPAGPHGSICPLLMCPLQNAITNEVSGIEGLSICLSIALAEILRKKHKALFLSLRDILVIVKAFCTFFMEDVMTVLPSIDSSDGATTFKSAVLHIVNHNAFNRCLLQNVFTLYGVKLQCKEVLREFSNFLQQEGGIDMIVDKFRARVRETMFSEINRVLFDNNVDCNNMVTRINLSDSDLIGGDNSKQEMSAAAFVSQTGALVTWHLTGRMRF